MHYLLWRAMQEVYCHLPPPSLWRDRPVWRRRRASRRRAGARWGSAATSSSSRFTLLSFPFAGNKRNKNQWDPRPLLVGGLQKRRRVIVCSDVTSGAPRLATSNQPPPPPPPPPLVETGACRASVLRRQQAELQPPTVPPKYRIWKIYLFGVTSKDHVTISLR